MESRSFDTPDETRPFQGNGFAELINIAGRPVSRGTFEPGWRWSTNLKPIVGTPSCQTSHLGYVLSGRMRITMDDGATMEVGPGDLLAIEPGHDAEVLGDESCVMVDFGEIGDYARPR
ncbi:cupin domain-containing protein [Asanoa sp. WMMD1127]|uniref:cupin domain-containing protein n=1 Tax=Asanoa sp. WMMD1127 TaxID=3016107 RepID=UPI0024170C29|nr:cupin domain-containing protein [Asanoa sp. WMMD1127]MDG4825539.1 cupin domain-containing protein [Asanoa sp. WMMD1127]